MKTIKKYLAPIGLLVAGLVVGAGLMMDFRPYPPGWGPLHYPKAAPLEWHTHAEYTGINGFDVAQWYCRALEGCDGIGVDRAQDPECDYQTCFDVDGVLGKQVVNVQVGVSETKVVVSQTPVFGVSASELLYDDKDARTQIDYVSLVIEGFIFLSGALAALGFTRSTKRLPKGHPLNRKLGITLILMALGLFLADIDDWIPLRPASSILAIFLGILLVMAGFGLQIKTNVEIRACESESSDANQ